MDWRAVVTATGMGALLLLLCYVLLRMLVLR